MGRNEIRIRRNVLTSGRIAQHRNYGRVMARHHRHLRIKRIILILIYFMIIVFLLLLFLLVRNTELRKKNSTKPQTGVEQRESFELRATSHELCTQVKGFEL